MSTEDSSTNLNDDTQSDIENDSNYSASKSSNNVKRKNSTKISQKFNKKDSNSRRKSPSAKDSKKSKSNDGKETRYLWVSGIPPGTKTLQLEKLFQEHGKVLAIKIIRGAGSSLLGFVKLETIEQAQKCMEKLNRTQFRGNKIDLFKERPSEKDEKKSEKISFRDPRKYLTKSSSRKDFRSSRLSSSSFRGSSKKLPSSSRSSPRVFAKDIRRREREETSRLEREKQKLKLERIKLERDKAELLKIERDRFERERGSSGQENKRSRLISKRSSFDNPFIDDKRFDEFRRDDYSNKRYESRNSPDRKLNRSFPTISSSSRGRFEDSIKDRYSDTKFDSTKGWQLSESSWLSTTNDRWNTASYDTASRMIQSNVTPSSLSRLHSDISSQPISARSYYASNRRY
ncbi:Scaffold attachment factor B2 [Sarcoptes scabiei]|uniref:Scaffold attachment factor B2 n=1 Tax=Sarcoptes scabiei TaxID=52283 RepID=A0A834RCJ2_SARSC|nr:Scaffold attachment factor B2 [Sarcoptes scabiei]